MSREIKIFGIVYGDKTTEYTPFFNRFTEKPWRFENDCMIDIIDNHVSDLNDDDLLGIFSWKFRIKTGLPRLRVYRSLQDFKGYDLYNFCRSHGKHVHFMDWSEDGHKGIKGFIQRCCDYVGLTYTNDPEFIVYANQFVAKKSVYVSYINNVIKPCLELLEGPMWEEVNRDPGYTKAQTGVYYNYVTFILERMMCQYIFNMKLKCINLNYR